MRREEVEKRLSQIETIPQLSSEKILAMQKEKLQRTLRQAYEDIPYYHCLFQEAGIKVEKLSLPQDMQMIPILKKEILQSNSQMLISTKSSRMRKISREITSGTSGHPTTVIKDRNKSAYIRAIMYRCYRQYGIDIGYRQARFWATPINEVDYFKQKFQDFLANRLFSISRNQ